MEAPDDLLPVIQRELDRRGLRLEEGCLVGLGLEVRVSQRSLIAEAAGGGEALGAFLDTVVSSAGPLPGWWVARSGIRLSLERADQDFAGSLHSPITPQTVSVLVHTDPQETLITWMSAGSLDSWHVDLREVYDQAESNLARLVAEASLRVENLKGWPLGLFETESVFKASFLLAPNLKEQVAANLGWPIRAVAPCRDFLYLMPDSDDLVQALGEAVLHEHGHSAYSVTTEVLRVGDEGISAIGEYRLAPEDSPQ